MDTINAVNAALAAGVKATDAKLAEHQTWLKNAFAGLRAEFFP
jgi:hypothetical protein